MFLTAAAVIIEKVIVWLFGVLKFQNWYPLQHWGVAQMVERSLSMRVVPGSIPGASTTLEPNRYRGIQVAF